MKIQVHKSEIPFYIKFRHGMRLLSQPEKFDDLFDGFYLDSSKKYIDSAVTGAPLVENTNSEKNLKESFFVLYFNEIH